MSGISKALLKAHCNKLTEELKSLVNALHPGAIVLSEYKNSRTKLDFKCDKGHLFSSRYDDIKAKHWCPTCAGVAKNSLETVISTINAMHPGASILSQEYINRRTKLSVRCENGHLIEINYDSIKSGYWCFECAGAKNEL